MGLREGVGAVAAHPHRRDHPGLRHLDAGRPQRRVAGQRRRGQGVEGELRRVQAQGGEVRQEVAGGAHVTLSSGFGCVMVPVTRSRVSFVAGRQSHKVRVLVSTSARALASMPTLFFIIMKQSSCTREYTSSCTRLYVNFIKQPPGLANLH